MGGIESVFTDFEFNGPSLVRALELVGEHELAAAWNLACNRLEEAGFLTKGKWTGARGPTELLDDLAQAVGERLWSLDPELARLLSQSRD